MTCSQTDVYEYIKYQHVGLRKEGAYRFPSLEELDILKIENSYYVKGTTLIFYGDDTTVNDFTYNLQCKHGKLNTLSVEDKGYAK